MKKNNTTVKANETNYSYTSYKSGNQTIMVWDDLARMMMGNGLPTGKEVIQGKVVIV